MEIYKATDWLSSDLPAWSTRTRFNARLVERDGVVLPTATLGLLKAQQRIPRSPLGGPRA